MNYYNEYTKKFYQGKNIDILKETGLEGGFVTFNQAVKLGGFIPKGTRAVAKLIQPMPGDLVKTPDGKIEHKVSGRRYSVFHVSQVQFDKEAN